MTPSFEKVQNLLKKLPGLGFRSAERIALHLLVEKPEILPELVMALEEASKLIKRCEICSNICEEELCAICKDPRRAQEIICVIEYAPDLLAIERSGAFRGRYHVLHGKLSPIQGIGPEQLNLRTLHNRVHSEKVQEIILALSNDIEGEATCHYIQNEIVNALPIQVSRIGFGLPSGAGVIYADSATLKSALEGRRQFL